MRIALNLKGIAPEEVVEVNLMKGQQRDAAFRAVNPMMALPALVEDDGTVLYESLAIIEYLDEVHPVPPLLPREPRGRARVRGLAQIIACDAHPLVVPRVRDYLGREFKLDEPARTAWCRHWSAQALHALEAHLSSERKPGNFVTAIWSASPTFASPAMRSARNFSRSISHRSRRCRGSPIPAAIRPSPAPTRCGSRRPGASV